MPLTKREVTPTEISVHRIPESVRTDELECVGNGSLANLVRQLSSLSKHAEDIFTELFREAVKIEHRTNTLTSRMERLTLKATQLESQEEQISIENLQFTKHYRTNQFIDQGSLNRSTMPSAMAECYTRCDAPPVLDKLNPYRDSDVPALKMYTDPDYFFILWRKEMLKDDVPKKGRVARPKASSSAAASSSKTPDSSRNKRRPRPPSDHRQKYIERVIKGGAIMDLPAEYHAPEYLRQQQSRYNQVPTQEPPRGMVIPAQQQQLHDMQQQMAYAQQMAHASTNGGGPYSSSGYGSQESQNSLQRQHNQNAVYQQPPMHASSTVQSQYQQGANQLPRVTLEQRGQYLASQGYYNSAEPTPPVTSQYMAAGYAMQQTPNAQYYQQPPQQYADDSLGRQQSPPDGSNRRPTRAPPAPPPATGGPPSRQLEKLHLSPVGYNGHMLEQRGSSDSPELPPPPPPLSSDELARMQSSTASTITDSGVAAAIGKMSPPPPVAGGGYIPPPPPPPSSGPAAAMQNSAFTKAGSPIKNGSVVGGGGGRTTSPGDRPKPHHATGGLFNPALLSQIREGKKLKKVTEKEEKERERAQTEQGGHDVAAILRKRMEKVMGTSDSDDDSEDRQFDSNDEWSDD